MFIFFFFEGQKHVVGVIYMRVAYNIVLSILGKPLYTLWPSRPLQARKMKEMKETKQDTKRNI